MKNRFKFILPMLFVFLACEEYEHGSISSDGENPLVIENVSITPINGGFDIKYDLPTDNDLLYVKAVYVNSLGEESEVKSSLFKSKIQILGFGDTEEKTIMLYAVDRSENISEPITVTGVPLTPPIRLIQESMQIVADFGGAKFSWENTLNTPISIELLTTNSLNELEIVKTQYTEQSSSKASLRGYETVPTLFAAVIRDRYDNYSDTIYAATPNKLLTPIFEERLDKTLFKQVILANDDNWGAWEGDYDYWFDDDMDTAPIAQGNIARPNIMTVDLGKTVVLSRFKLFQRGPKQPHWAFSHGNPKRYSVYGSKELPGQDGNLDDWILLKECESIKPSGLPLGTNTDEDMDHFEAGDEFTFDESTEIRYFRFALHETWDGSSYVNCAEITFWGQVLD